MNYDFNDTARMVPAFATPIVVVNLKKELDLEEMKPIFEKWKTLNNRDNEHNDISIYARVLDDIQHTSLYKSIMNYVNFYFYEIMKVHDGVKPLITESWTNITKPGEMHHVHNHANSVVSGVFYSQCDVATGDIIFVKPYLDQLKFELTEFTPYNEEEKAYTPEPYDLLLFKSNIQHKVVENKSKLDRVSMAFNTFFEGEASPNYSTIRLNIRDCK